MSRFGEFTINGVKYDMDDLTLDEIEVIEDLVQRQRQLPDGTVIAEATPFAEINYGSSKAMKAIAFTLMKRNEPDMTYADVGSVKVINFAPADEELPELPPESKGEETQNASAPADSGALRSVESIAG